LRKLLLKDEKKERKLLLLSLTSRQKLLAKQVFTSQLQKDLIETGYELNIVPSIIYNNRKDYLVQVSTIHLTPLGTG
jgi:hypothetical protein